MNILNSRLYTFLESLGNFFILNILWIILCIPIVTIFPATSAMYSVIRRWKMEEDKSVFGVFFHYFKVNFKQSFLIGLIWFLFAILLYIDYFLMVQVDSNLKVALLVPLFLVGLLLLCTTVLLFPVMSHYDVSWKYIIKNSFLISMAYFPMTLFNLILLAALLVALYYYPVISLLAFSIGANINYSLCGKLFQRVDNLMEEESK